MWLMFNVLFKFSTYDIFQITFISKNIVTIDINSHSLVRSMIE